MDFISVIIAIACASIMLMFLVFIHEGGHYLASRAFGVRVSEFMIGFPGPGIKFKRGETRFGITCVPLGGYARVCGMEVGETSAHIKDVLVAMYNRGTADVEDVAADCNLDFDCAQVALDELVEWGCVTPPKKSDEFNTYRLEESARPTRGQLRRMRKAARMQRESASEASSPAPAALATPPTPPLPAHIHTSHTSSPEYPQLYAEGQARPLPKGGADALFKQEFNVQYKSLPFWKRAVILLAGITVNLLFAMLCFVLIYSVIGFDISLPDSDEVRHITVDPLRSIQAGFMYIAMVAQAVLSLFNPQTAADTVSNSTSIVGITVMSKDAFDAGLTSALMFTAAISVSLGIMNLLPIPPLDGGRFVIEIIQKIMRRPISVRAMNTLTMLGMALFMAFFVIMLNQDIQRFVFGG